MAAGSRNPFEGFRVELDPERLEEALRRLRDRVEKLRDQASTGLSQAQYTRVRVSYKGRQLGPDVPLTLFLAGEGVALALLGPLKAVLGNLAGKVFLDVELLHDADELVAEGREAYGHGELETAEARYREALERRKDDPSALYHLGVLLRVSGRADEALHCFHAGAAGPEGHPDVVRCAEMIGRLQGGRTL
ncbi:MAG: tetratricopeptide repeat protein [Alphaproteobacteria bacterium]|nr:tetratricopeptide repeat protein [Alphaproteobacteria bacterium]